MEVDKIPYKEFERKHESVWRIRHSIAKRRKRSMFAAILALAFIILAPTLGASLVGGINSHLPQQNAIVLDGNITAADTIYGSSASNGTVHIGSSNYTSDVSSVSLLYLDANSTLQTVSQSYTFTSDNKLFMLVAANPSEGIGPVSVQGRFTPSLYFTFPFTPIDMKNAGISQVRIYFNDGKAGPLHLWFRTGSASSYRYVYVVPVNVSANGTWFTFNISQLQLLTGASSSTSSLPLVVQVDTGGSLVSGDSVLMGLQLIGPVKGGILHNWQNVYFGIAGMIAFIAAIFATPFINIRSFEKKKEDKVKGFKKSDYKKSDHKPKDEHHKDRKDDHHRRDDKGDYHRKPDHKRKKLVSFEGRVYDPNNNYSEVKRTAKKSNYKRKW